MEVASPPLMQQQHLGDSFSRGWLTKSGARSPSLERLVADAGLGDSFGSSRSFIDMDPGELFSMRWTGPPESDFDFGLIIPGVGAGGSDPPSPVLVSASRVIRHGRLLPSDPVCLSGGIHERGTEPPTAPLFRSRSALLVVKHVDHLRKNCLWSKGDADRNGKCLVAWEECCKPKSEGGLGIINIEEQNDALLMKYLDKFYNEANLPWVKLTWNSLYLNQDTLPHARTPSGSFWWKDVMKLFNK